MPDRRRRRRWAERARARPAAAAIRTHVGSPGAGPFPWLLAFRDDVEHEATGDGTRLHQAYLDLVSKAVRHAGPAASQALLPGIMLPIVVRQSGDGDDAARTTFRQCDEERESRHARNSPCEMRPGF